MYILGISCFYHDAAAALLLDGKIVAAAEEERFSRQKHDFSFPFQAIDFCLASQRISINDIAYIAFYEKPFLKLERVLFSHLATFPRGLRTFVISLPGWFKEKLRLVKIIKKKLKFKGPILFIEHHLAHAASAFFPSPFERAAILTADGVGEWTTASWGRGAADKINLIEEINFPHSLGLLYSTITAYLGFSVNNSEYKVMGLSAFGEQDKEQNHFYRQLKKAIDIKEDGSFRLDLNYFSFHYADRMPTEKLCRLLGGPIRRKSETITQRHKDIAAALQMITEEILFKILNYIHEKTGEENLVLAGGVALNSVANGKILESTPFQNVWIQPNATDGGASLGAALFAYHQILDQPRSGPMQDIYLGPDHATEEIRRFLTDNKIKFQEFAAEELINQAASLIFNNKTIGWFQGRMEWGPRALGNRSILANPLNPAMKDLVNQIKGRENFRPLAPAVCEDEAEKYFFGQAPWPEPARFMLMTWLVRPAWRTKLTSVTHVDGSARLQIVGPSDNKKFYNLLKAFGRLAGAAILLNTSFNVRGEPIVYSPADAYNCFRKTRLDYLVLDNFLIKRDEFSND